MSTSPGPTRKLVHPLPVRTGGDHAVVPAPAFDAILERQRVRAHARDEHLAVLVFEQRPEPDGQAPELEPLGRVLSERIEGARVGWLADGRLGMLLDTAPTDTEAWRRRLAQVSAAIPASETGDALVRTSVRVITDDPPADPPGRTSWSMPLCW